MYGYQNGEDNSLTKKLYDLISEKLDRTQEHGCQSRAMRKEGYVWLPSVAVAVVCYTILGTVEGSSLGEWGAMIIGLLPLLVVGMTLVLKMCDYNLTSLNKFDKRLCGFPTTIADESYEGKTRLIREYRGLLRAHTCHPGIEKMKSLYRGLSAIPATDATAFAAAGASINHGLQPPV